MIEQKTKTKLVEETTEFPTLLNRQKKDNERLKKKKKSYCNFHKYLMYRIIIITI